MSYRNEKLTHFLVLLAFWPLFPSLSLGQGSQITATATHTQKRPLELSDTLPVTLTIEGPAPLRIEFQKKRLANGREAEQYLADESNRDWKIVLAGPATKTPLAKDRERWSQPFRLEPYTAAGPTVILFAPITVNGRVIPGPSCEVTVNPPAIEAKAGSAMSVTAIEELPPPAQPPGPSFLWVLVPVLALVIVAVVILVRAGRKPRPVPPYEWASAAFDRLERDAIAGAALVEALAATVRGFIDRRFATPATRLTTEELLAAAEQAAWPVEQRDSLKQLLEECDRAKFAGDVPDEAGCRSLLSRAREWVDHTNRAPNPT